VLSFCTGFATIFAFLDGNSLMKKRSFYFPQTENEEISENSPIFNFKLQKKIIGSMVKFLNAFGVILKEKKLL